MKLFVCAVLMATATVAFGQSQKAPTPIPAQGMGAVIQRPGGFLDAPGQSGCPVVLTSAHLNWPAAYLPATTAGKATEPNLALGFQNSSGKAIQSVTIAARFLVKQNVYALDASAFDLRLTFSGADADKAAEQLREIRVPEKMYAYGVTRVSLEQVLFEDGTFWTAVGHQNCSLDVRGSTERVAK